MSGWDFSDAITVLGYFIINLWVLIVVFQILINLLKRCLGVSARTLFLCLAAVCAGGFVGSVYYLVGASGKDDNIRNYITSLTIASFALFFFLIRGAILVREDDEQAPARNQATQQQGTSYLSILRGGVTSNRVGNLFRSEGPDRRHEQQQEPRFKEEALPSYEEAVKEGKSSGAGDGDDTTRVQIDDEEGSSSGGGSGSGDDDDDDRESQSGGELPPPPFAQALHI